MPEPGTKELIELLEKVLMVQLHSLGVSQGDIASMLKKSKSSVNEFLKPLAKKTRP